MRLGVLADVHANAYALDAVLRELRRERVDAYLCAGDLVGYGPHPDECVSTIAGLGASCVAGNHDLIAIGRLSDARCERLARRTLAWTSEVLTDATGAYLRQLPRMLTQAELVAAHGSLDDPETYVTRGRAAGELARFRERHPGRRLLVLGHTHRPLAFGDRSGLLLTGAEGSVDLDADERYLLNPGSVGQSRERDVVARFMVLDLERRRATFLATGYDHRRCRAALRARGLPATSYHRDPGRPAARARAMRRRLRHALAARVNARLR